MKRLNVAIVVVTVLVLGIVAGFAVRNMLWHRPRTIVLEEPTGTRPAPLDAAALQNARPLFEMHLAELIHAKEPLFPKGFQSAPVDPEQNAALDYIAAGELLQNLMPDAPDLLEIDGEHSADEWRQINQRLVALEPVLALLDQAYDKPALDWQVQLDTPVYSTLLRHLPYGRTLAPILRADALAAHHAGDDARAVQRAAQLLRLARDFERQPFLIGYLVSMSLTEMVTETIARIAPGLRIGDHPAASPQQVRALLQVTLDESSLRDGLRRGILFERMAMLDMMRSTAESIPDPYPANASSRDPEPITRGHVYTDALTMLNWMTSISKAAESHRLPDFHARMPAAPPLLHVPQFAEMAGPFIKLPARKHYENLTQLRLCSTAIAIRLWTHEHGQLPPSLEALVPQYLPAIADDPLRPMPMKLQYRAGPDAMVWSNGRHLTDEGAPPELFIRLR